MDVATVKLDRGGRLLFQLPLSSRVINKLHPNTQWGWQEILANKTNFLLETLVWQNSFDPKKKAEHKAKRPKPFIPDFLKEPKKLSAINEGSVALDTDEVKAILNKDRT